MIQVVLFRADGSLECGDTSLLALPLAPDDRLWIDVEGQTEDSMAFVEGLGFHSMAVKDCFTLQHQPKIEDYDDCVFLIVRGIDFNRSDGQLETLKLAAFLTAERLVTFHRAPMRSVRTVRERLRESHRSPPGGLSHLLYSLYEEMIGLYFPVVDEVGDQLEELEDAIFSDPREEQLVKILALKKRLASLRRVMLPHRQVFNHLGSGSVEEIDPREAVFFRDVYDDVVRLADAIDLQRDQLLSVRDTYLSVISQRTNEIMKVLTVISAVLLPLTVIAGIYGMNFQHMPELERPWAYPTVLGLMAAVGLGMFFFFRRRGWI